MEQKISAYVREHRMLQNGDRIIAGVSGGADSICLLFVLLKFQKEYDLDILAVHVHHGLRGESADRDERYVREICEQWGVELRVFHEDVRGYAKKMGMTEEEAGRMIRRHIFSEIVEEQPERSKAALAHHMNDNAETILFHMCRGTGPKGLTGIAPVTGPWIRPLLCVERKEIESYLGKCGISYCIDETNLEDSYARNKIRNCIYPYLEDINDQVTAHISQTAEQMRGLWEYVEGEVVRWKGYCSNTSLLPYEGAEADESIRADRDAGSDESVRADGKAKTDQATEIIIDARKFLEVPDALKSYVSHSIICQAAGRAKDIGNVHVEQVQKLLSSQVGRRIQLPYQIEALRCYEGIKFFKSSEEDSEENTGMSRGVISDADREISRDIADNSEKLFEFRIFDRDPEINSFPENLYTKWFDYDIIKNAVKMRHKEPGDYITIDKNGNTQKLKKYFTNAKIPEQSRGKVWLAADGDHIMWIVGYRQNQMYQITDETKRILEIKFCEGEKLCQRK